MTGKERKRQTGYFDLSLTQFCGNCRNCKRNGSHLRCVKFDYPVLSLGICRAGWQAVDKPITSEDCPLLTYTPEEVQA